MSKEAMKLALEALELVNLEFVCANGSHHAKKDRHEWDEDCPITNRWRKAITALQEALVEQPAQQEPLTDIYRSFEQWKSGNVLEHGVPRTEYYSEAQLDLVEMGWNYGYDAGRAVEQALDRKAENARELGLDYEPIQCPVCKAEDSPYPKCGCVIYVDEQRAWFTIDELNAWADKKLKDNPQWAEQPAQRTWVSLTDEEIQTEWVLTPQNDRAEGIWFGRRIEAKLKEKNT